MRIWWCVAEDGTIKAHTFGTYEDAMNLAEGCSGINYLIDSYTKDGIEIKYRELLHELRVA